MLTDTLQFGVLALYMTLVPGLPLALHLARKVSNWRLVLAFSPVLSLGSNYLLLYALNFVGIRPNLVLVGLLLVAATIALFVCIGLPSWDELKVVGRETSPILPAFFIGAVIWRQALAGYVLLAPNEDGIRHNLWITRIANSGSVLSADSLVDSPLQRLGSGGGFYPFAWHADVAIGSQLSTLGVAAASLMSVAVFWTVVLPAGLSALAKVWSPQTRHLGALAALLSQLYPLVPALPLASGSMTSCVGIALLPAGVIATSYMLTESNRIWVFAAAAVAVTIFFVHTPEAATLAVLALVYFLTIGRARLRHNLARVAVGIVVLAVPTFWIFRDSIFGDTSLVYGATEPDWARAIGVFFAVNVNAHGYSIVLALIFIAGIITAFSDSRERWLLYCTFALGAVYLVAGSATGFPSKIRVLTTPWYASYERTLWVVVPFAAMISAYAIARLLPANLTGNRLRKAIGGSVAASLLCVVAFQQVEATINQMSYGPAISAMVGADDLTLMREARDLIHDGEIAIGFSRDGTIYPYVYEGIRVTGGASLGADGRPSVGIATIMAEFRDLCSSPPAMAAFEQEKVAAVFLAKRGVWGEKLWTDSAAAALEGLDIVRSGDLLILLIPDIEECG